MESQPKEESKEAPRQLTKAALRARLKCLKDSPLEPATQESTY